MLLLPTIYSVILKQSQASFNVFSIKGHHPGHHQVKDGQNRTSDKWLLNIGLILPHTNFGVREYTRAINNAVAGLHRGRGRSLVWVKERNFNQRNVHNVLMTLTPSPTGKLSILHKHLFLVYSNKFY